MQAAKKGMLNIVCGFLGQIVIIAIGIVVPRLVVVSYGSGSKWSADFGNADFYLF